MEKWAGILCCLVYICILVRCPVLAANGSYPIDPSGGVGRQFDGIGGLSGGGGLYSLDTSAGLGRVFDGIGALDAGATSKLLVNYAEPYRSQILDYLFKPNFGASLHILKVEIGGDGQSTDGTESSHMHESWDENYKRGYEWWLMVEAKKRNPNIKLYGLSWAFPGWVSNGTGNPYSYPELTATYTTKWIMAAKKYYDLTIDYIGIWNERNYDINYVKVLRKTLDQYGQQHVQISVADTSWGVAGDILKDHSFAAAVDIIGAHYPGTYSTSDAVKTGKPLWAAEDYSTFNDNVGGGCWARLLNRNYVNGMMTSTISWNLIASYYESLPFGRDGLMTAESPWSGSYVVESPIWISAHTTQFTQIGWKYLQHDSGVGHLDMGGTYVSLVSPDNKDFTMVVETMTHNHSICIRPPLKPYDVKPQKATFMLKGALSHISQLNVWYTKFMYDGSEPTFFKSMQPVQVTGGQFGVFLDVDVVYTFTTVNTGMKGSYPDPPPSKPFPLPYRDNFESYAEYSEAYNMVPQVGVWEVRTTSDPNHSKVNRQVMLNMPVRWCGGTSSTINIIGNNTWSNIYVSTDAFVPSVNGSLGAMVGARVSNGGCGVDRASGVFFWVFPRNHTFKVTSDMKFAHILVQGNIDPKITLDSWFTISVMVNKNTAEGYTGSTSIFKVTLSGNPGHGYAAVGTADYGLADFDNFSITGIEPVVIRDIPKK